MRRVRSRLTYANVTATIALVIAVAGGTAYAANTVFSSDIVDGQVKSPDIGNNQVQSVDVRDDTLAGGGLTGADLRTNAVGSAEISNSGVRSSDVGNEALTGADIANQSGVDTCVAASARIGQLCVRVENSDREWSDALAHCASLDLRLPSLSEALELALTHDIPNVDEDEFFWTADRYFSGGLFVADVVDDSGGFAVTQTANQTETVCVTTPTN